MKVPGFFFNFIFSLYDPHSNIVRVTVLSESQKLLIFHIGVLLHDLMSPAKVDVMLYKISVYVVLWF